MKQIERIDNVVQVMGDRVDYKLPAIEYQLNRNLKGKADMSDVEKMIALKVDKTFVD